MSRPIKEGLDYFPHDTDACNDEKIDALRALFGNDSYAFYFILLERIYKTKNGLLDISNKAIKASVVKKIGISEEKFDEILKVAFEIGLFLKDYYEKENKITSHGILKRFEEVDKMRVKWRNKKDKDNSPEVFQGVFSGENSEETMGKRGESKEKKSKEKQSKENTKDIYNDVVKLTKDEHTKLQDKFGYELEDKIENLALYIQSKGDKYKSHYHTLISWEKNKNKENGYSNKYKTPTREVSMMGE